MMNLRRAMISSHVRKVWILPGAGAAGEG